MLPLLLACADPPPPDIVLVSLDTTRADVIDPETTPNLWAVASRGVRFTAAFAHAPTTLSSHASVWTGLDPHGHAVARNGYALAADLPVLPERLAAAGYDTVGVVGASALARPMGVDRGFRRWDEQLEHTHQRRHEARASEVTDRALAALGKRRRGEPVFLFVHYYDAHAPYQAPAPYTARWSDPTYGGTFDGSRAAMQAVAEAARAGTLDPADVAEVRARYRGEVSYVDAELGRLLATLHDPYVVVFGDHGEALGDVADRPWGHGPDVDPPAVRVPLIVAGPGLPTGAVVDAPVALSDVGPTVLGLAGLHEPLGKGRDLAPLWSGTPFEERPIFVEATQPKPAERTDGWNNLSMERGVVRGPWMLLTTPWLGVPPSLIRFADGAPQTLWPTLGADGHLQPTETEVLTGLLAEWDAAAPPFREDTADADTKAGLKALGYVE